MDVTFTEEQQALRDATAALLGDHADPQAAYESETGSDLGLYDRLIALGAGELPGLVELGVVLEECGRALAPAPVVSVLGVAAQALAALDGGAAAELAAATASGAARPVLALEGEAGVLARVPEAHVATHVLFADGEGLYAADTAGCRVTPLPSMDPTRRLCTVDVSAAARTELGAAAGALGAARLRGAVALAHELVGVGQATLDLAVRHAREREQFGRPVGVYQAVSHRCADMFVALEAARSHTYYAAWAVEAADGEADAPVTAAQADLAASRAKAAASEAAVTCAEGCIQIHGGMGFTWEHDAHRYLRRARWGAALLGTATEHRRRVADLLGL